MNKKKGLTLIELIIVLAITPIILGLIYKVVISSFRMINVETKKSNVNEQAKTYISTLSNDLKNSRKYLEADEIRSNSDLASVLPPRSKPVVYIESYSNKRYMYVLEEASGGKYDLKLYNFQVGVVPNKYKPIVVSGSYNETFVSQEVFLKLDADSQNRISINAHNLVDTLLPDYVGEFIYYDNFEYESYLIAKKGSDYYKIELEIEEDSYNTTIDVKNTLMQYVEDATVKRNIENDKLCSIMVKAIDDGKVKEISTDVYVFVQP